MTCPRFLPVVAPAPPGKRLLDPAKAARHAAVWLLDQRPRVRPGGRVAIAVGSRGLTGLATVLAQVTGLLRARGACPFIIPAMGSHGGGTPAGQREVLAGLGVTEEAAGTPIVAAPAARPIGRTGEGRPVHCHLAALAADAVVVINRVKSHSAFDGQVQSGLLKMLAVGLGGPAGAREVHRRGATGMEEAILDLARALAGRLPLAGGLATVENAGGELVAVEPSRGTWDSLRSVDARCLRLAAILEPRLPVGDLDLLLVDWMGKDICGPGMDPKVVGRRRVWDCPEPKAPNVRRLVVFRLTPASQGNANGIGLADFTTRRLAESVDWPRTLGNARTTTFTQRAVLPPALESDRDAVEAALETLLKEDPRTVRAMRITDTGHLDRAEASEALLRELAAAGWTAAGPPEDLPFGPDGNLPLLRR